MPHKSELKEELRRAVTQRIMRMSDAERRAEGRTVSRRVMPQIPKGSVVCGYYPLKNEADIRPLLTDLIERGDKVFLPCFANQKLAFRRTDNLYDLPKGELNIPEPRSDAEELAPETLNVVLVPGRAFDRKGNRLGRGAGGYDRWIEAHRKKYPDTILIGVALECQLVDDIPMEAHDQLVNFVATARGVVKCEELKKKKK